MRHFHAFGCSFTCWTWGTWADIIHSSLTAKEICGFTNHGRAGAGNGFIFNKFIHALDNITSDDVVMIMWTNVSREDRFIDGDWKTEGNIFTNRFYDDDFIKKYVDIRGYYERDIPIMHAVQRILDNIGCEHKIMSMVDISNHDQYTHNDNSDEMSELFDKFSPTLDRILPSVHDIVFNYDYNNKPIPGLPERNTIYSCHPTPLEHLDYVKQVLPEYEITPGIHEMVSEWDKQVLNAIRKNPHG